MDKTARILIVDDTELNRDVLEGLVTALGHQPIVVDSGSKALDLLAKGPAPDLILLDILMPEISGFDVLKKVKQDKELRGIPIIMISIVDEIESIVRCIEYGADDFMVKPFNAILLKARINACLEKKEHNDKARQFNYWLAESYQKLQKAEQSRDEMLNMIVHDLNNSLVSIIGESELLMQKTVSQDNGEIKQSVENIHNAGSQIRLLVREILDIAKIEKGSLKPDKKPTDVVAIIKDIERQYDVVVRKRNGSIEVTCSEPSIVQVIDETLFRRILQNLLTNAVKHGMTADKPMIGIDVSKENDRVRLVVSDNGLGVPKDQTEKIFHKYHKIKPENKGLGLGLAFCKMAVEVMGGTISCDQTDSNGASFTLLL